MANSAEEAQKEFRDLCYQMGLAMMTWQLVEEAHFITFYRMIGVPKIQIASSIYYSIESFQLRHTMLDRIAHFFLEGREHKKQRKLWENESGGLKSRLHKANLNRNKIAHYTQGQAFESRTELPNGGVSLVFNGLRLQPSSFNWVSRLLGQASGEVENLQHSLSVEAVKTYRKEFNELSLDLNEFADSLKPQPPSQDFYKALVQNPEKLRKDRQSERPSLSGKKPSAE